MITYLMAFLVIVFGAILAYPIGKMIDYAYAAMVSAYPSYFTGAWVTFVLSMRYWLLFFILIATVMYVFVNSQKPRYMMSKRPKTGFAGSRHLIKRAFSLIFILALLIQPVAAREPLEITDVIEDGYIYKNGAGYNRFNATDYILLIYFIGDPDISQGFIEWNISTIPDTTKIEDVWVKYYLSDNNLAYTSPIYQIEYQPSITNDTQLYKDIENGTEYHPNNANHTEGWVTLPMSGAASDLETLLASDWFAIGFDSISGVDAKINTTESGLTPVLIVGYHFPGDYEYYFNGAFYENGTGAGAIDVTTEFTATQETFELNGSSTEYYAADPESFYWQIPIGGIRRIYNLDGNASTNYVFIPESTPSSYDFTIIDYTAKIGSIDAYIEAYRYVNGTKRLIERNKINDVVNAIPLTLVPYQTYSIQVVFADSTTYDFGEYVPGLDPEKTLNIRGMDFDQKLQLTYKYLIADANRVNDTHMNANYSDSLLETNWVEMTITYWNESSVYSSNTTGNNISFAYSSLDGDYRYKVFFDVSHQSFGEFRHITYLDALLPYEALPDLTVFGSFGGLDTSYLYSILVMLISLGAGWFASAGVAVLLAVIGLGILVYIGASPFSFEYTVILMIIAIMYLLSRGEKKQ